MATAQASRRPGPDVTTDDLRVLLGGQRAVQTACGLVTLSPTQTSWAVDKARHIIGFRWPHLRWLTDIDIAWLLTRGWQP
jgi:hypothetical protein